MSVTYKDIDDLSQKSSVAGTEKIPVSDTEYITPSQITGDFVSKDGGTMSADAELEFVDSDGYYVTNISPAEIQLNDDDQGLYIDIDVREPGLIIGTTGDTYTKYANGSIVRDDAIVNIPTSAGTLALTSQIPNILSGTSDPASNLGSNGDIYIKLSS